MSVKIFLEDASTKPMEEGISDTAKAIALSAALAVGAHAANGKAVKNHVNSPNAKVTSEMVSAITQSKEYNERVRRGENITAPLDDNAIQEKSIVGKIAFGINYGGKEQDSGEAVKNALLAYRDGLFRMFIGDAEPASPDAEISLSDGDVLTFVRLVMLTGRMW